MPTQPKAIRRRRLDDEAPTFPADRRVRARQFELARILTA